MTVSSEPFAVSIISSDPVTAWAMQELLAREPQPPVCYVAPDPPPPGARRRAPDLLIVAPQTWQEMSRWLPDLEREFVSSRWLVRSRLRVAGMFLTPLSKRPLCGIVSPLATPEDLLAEFRALVEGRPLCPPAQLLAHINAALRAMPGKEQMPTLEMRELECGCAVSLGLNNSQIARALLLSQGAVKNALTELYRKLRVRGRQKAGELIEQAVFAASAAGEEGKKN